jgi:hypothetical protein
MRHALATTFLLALLCACDEQTAGPAPSQRPSVQAEEGCARAFFYNVSGPGGSGTILCSEGKDQCLGEDGEPRDTCA